MIRFFVIFFFSTFLSSENENISIKITADFFEVDNFGNIYVINKDEIVKYDINLNILNSFSSKDYGNVTELDVSNPFKILLFYKAFNKILILDNNLAKINELDLNYSDFYDISNICSSSQSGFWIYDDSFKKIFLINHNFVEKTKSKYLGKYIEKKEITNIIEIKNNIYLGIKNSGILIFDSNANIKTFVEFDLQNRFSVTNNENIFFLNTEKNQIVLKELFNEKETVINKYNNLKDFKLQNQKKIFLTQDSLIITQE